MRGVFALVLLSSLCAGCYTKMVRYEVSSEPSGAQVDVNGAFMGNTPTTITLGASKHWVGLAYSPSGWQYGTETYEVTVYPPPDAKEKLVSQTKRITPGLTPEGGRLFFNLRLEPVYPTQPVQVR